MFLTGTYTLSHARWDYFANDEPEALGVTQEQAAELCEAVDAGWERAVQHAGREFGLELKVEWVDAGASHCLKMDSDGFPLTNVVEVSIWVALEQATDHVTGEWGKQHFPTG